MAGKWENALVITSSTNSVALDSTRARYAARFASRGVLWLAPALVLVGISWRFAEVQPSVLFRPATLGIIWTVLASLFPPDLAPNFLRTVASAVIQTSATAVSGTVLLIA